MSGFESARGRLASTVTSIYAKKSSKPMVGQLKAKDGSGRCSSETFVLVWNNPDVTTVEQFINTINALPVDPFTGSANPGWDVSAKQASKNTSDAFQRCKSIRKRAQAFARGDGTGQLAGIAIPMKSLEYAGTYANARSSNRMSAQDWGTLVTELQKSVGPAAMPSE